jgi:uncharacterized protein (TIGR00269 family)
MKCKFCSDKPVVHLKPSNLYLCENHFLERVEEVTKRAIKKFNMFDNKDRILVAVSGGKDSLSLLYLLNKLGYYTRGLYINLGIEEREYSDESFEYVKKFSEKFHMDIYTYNLKEEKGKGITDIMKHRKNYKACSVCGIVKRYIMNKIALEKNFNVLATGHNLDDEVSRLFGNIVFWQEGYLLHQNPVLEEEKNKLLKKVKPFCFISEKQTALYAYLRGIEYVRNECPYSIDAKTIFYKNILNRVEENSSGAKLRFYKGFLDIQKKYFKKVHKKYTEIMGEEKECKICGMPTLKEICGFCRIFERV